jgi:hypothetical protein
MQSLPSSSPPSLPPGQEANTDNETVGKEASQMRDILPKLHHVSDHAPKPVVERYSKLQPRPSIATITITMLMASKTTTIKMKKYYPDR